MERQRAFHSILKVLGILLLVVILPLVLGYLVSLYLFPTPEIAVIRLEGDIWSLPAASLGDAMEAAGADPAVKAVVLDIASPGGEVTASENLYYDVLKLREQKPVIASVNELAASGAYYMASGADTIFAKPSSSVGNIGVISYLPEPDFVDEELLTTGPFKLSGGPPAAYVRQMEMMKDSFVAAVMAQRAGRLQVGPEVLSRGEIYLGLQAKEMGLVDELGSRAEAVSAAANMAGVRHYKIVDRTPVSALDQLLEEELLPAGGSTAATLSISPENMPPGFYFRYVQPLQ
jgi:protease-4